jgi:putative membrane protein
MREPKWRLTGQEPDYRFTLANERTFLAWIRTALGLLASGVVLDQLSTRLQPGWAALALVTGLCALATALCLLAYAHWRANEIAMRHARRLPSTAAIPLLALGMLVAAAGVLVLLMVR